MKVKLTPLNIVSAVFLVIAVLLLTDKKEAQYPGSGGFTWLFVGFSFLAALIAFVSDLIFRKFIPGLKKLWIVEGVLVVFIVILIFIIKASTS